MKYLLLFEELFNPPDYVEYKGQRARVVSREGDKYKIRTLGNNSTDLIDAVEADLKNVPRCLGRCDIEIQGKAPFRKIYCHGCDRYLKRT